MQQRPEWFQPEWPSHLDPDISEPQPEGYPELTPVYQPGGQRPWPVFSDPYKPDPGGGGPTVWRPYYPAHPKNPRQPGRWLFPPGIVQDEPGGQPYRIPGWGVGRPGGPAGPPMPWIERPAPHHRPMPRPQRIPGIPIPDGGPFRVPGKWTIPDIA
jgi:hypothetical protein